MTNKSKPVMDNLPLDEKIKIVQSTDVLQRVAQANRPRATLGQAVLHAIPLAGLYALIESLVHQQYYEEIVATMMLRKLATLLPVLVASAFIVNRWVERSHMQAVLFVASILSGIRMLEIVVARSTYGLMLQSPGLATIWIYAIAQLRLLPAVLGLALVGLYHCLFTLKTLRQDPEWSL